MDQPRDKPSTSATPDPVLSIMENLEETPRKKKIKRKLFQELKKSSVKSHKVKQLRQKVRRYKKKLCL